MKILILSYKFWPDVGGIEVNTEILSNFFVKFKAEVHLITTTKVEKIQKRTFPYKIIRSPTLRELIQEHLWADIVFENNPVLHLSWPLILSRRKHVVAVRTWISRNDGRISLRDRIKHKWVRSADKIIAVSKEVKNSTSSKAAVIGNPYRNELFRVLNGKKKDRDFVFLGRLVSDKGADMSIDLLRIINAEKTGSERFTLSIIGDGPERTNLEELVHKHSLTDCVDFTGFLGGETLVRYLNRHKFILIPSLWKEPFGNVALEGMACGCIPIVSNGGGLPDAVGDAGLVFERGNLQSLIEVMEMLISKPQLQVRLQQESIIHLGKHDPEAVSGQYLKIIEDTFTENKNLLK